MEKIIIIGGGGHSKVIQNIIRRDYKEYEIIGYVDQQNKNLNIPYLGKENAVFNFDNKNFKLVIGIGQIDEGIKRKELIKTFLEKGYNFLTIVSKKAIIADSSIIGEGTVVFDNVVVNVDCKIGDFCILNTGCIVEHDCYIGNFVHLSPGVVLSGGVKIGDNCFLGSGSVVKHYTTICDNVIIGAGSVVVKNITEKGTFVGIPAKKIK